MLLHELYDFALNTVFFSFVICFVLIVWNETNAFVEYTRLFLGAKFESYKPQENAGILFVDYLEVAHPNSFLVKLICCPICLAVWLSIFVSIYLSNYLIFFSTFYISMVLYFKFKTLMYGADSDVWKSKNIYAKWISRLV